VIAKGGVINLVGLFFSIVVNFLFQFILVRVLDPGDVGIFNLALTITGIIGLLVIFGLDRAVVRQIAYFLGKNEFERELGVTETSVGLVFLITFLVLPLSIILAHPLSTLLFRKPDLEPILRILIYSIPFVMLTRLAMGILQAYKQMKQLVLVEQIFIPFIRVLGTLFVIVLFVGSAPSIAFAYLLMSIIGSVVAIYVAGKYYFSRKGKAKPVLDYSGLLQLAWPLLGASLLNRTNTFTETLMLGIFSSSEQVGLFSVSFKIAVTLTVIFQAINIVIAPFIAELFAKEDHNELSHQFKAVTRWGFILTLPIGLFLFLTARDILTVLNPEYLEGVIVLQILSISQLMYAIVGPVAIILTMTHYMRLNLIDLLGTLGLSLVLDIIFIPRYGASGAALAGAISIVFINLVRLIQVYKFFGLHPYDAGYIKPLIASFIAVIATVGVGHFALDFSHIARILLLGFTLFLVYGMAIILFRFNNTDREVLQLLFHGVLARSRK